VKNKFFPTFEQDISATVRKVALLLILAASTGCTTLDSACAQEAEDKPANKPAMTPSLKKHPVLKVRPFEPALIKPNSSVFKKLNGMLKMPSVYKAIDSSYENAEFTVVQEFCDQARGQTTHAVEKLGNEPFLKGGESPCQPTRIAGNEDWLYIFGTTPIFARLVFKNGICTESWANFYYNDPWYTRWFLNWRGSQIDQFAVGKTIAEIVDREGTPDDSSPYVIATGSTPAEVTDFWKNLKIKQGTLVYETGSSICTVLRFKDSVCVELGGSFRTGRHEHSRLPFRMPPRE
jgi:hypothetical protein